MDSIVRSNKEDVCNPDKSNQGFNADEEMNADNHWNGDAIGSDVSLDIQSDADDSPQRATWGNKIIEFLFSVIGYSVGLGNVWRFPYLCQKNGGGAFLITYTIMLILIGTPMFYLEMLFGQTIADKGKDSSISGIKVWRKIPFLGGLGYAMVMLSFFISLYYGVIITWAFYYTVLSLTVKLPWADCPTVNNVTVNISSSVQECDMSDSVSYYWYRQALDISGNIGEIGGIKFEMCIVHIGIWTLIFFIFLRFVKRMKFPGKVLYVTATVITPCILLIVFFVRGLHLPGAIDGITYMLNPKLDCLKDPTIWLDAASQVLFCLDLATGDLVAHAQHNPRRKDFRRHALFVSAANWCAAIFSSTIIFSFLGFKANRTYDECMSKYGAGTVHQHLPPDNANLTDYEGMNVKPCSLEAELNAFQGPGLVFNVFSEAASEMPLPPLWSVFLFGMLFVLGLRSQLGSLWTMCSNICDLELHPLLVKRWIVSGLICLVSAVLGLVFMQRSGNYWLELFDWFFASFPLLSFGILQVIGIVYLLGARRLSEVVRQPVHYWRTSWYFISPAMLLLVVIGAIVHYVRVPPRYNAYDKELAKTHLEEYPFWTWIVIGVLASALVLLILVTAIGSVIASCRTSKSTASPDTQYCNSASRMLQSLDDMEMDTRL